MEHSRRSRFLTALVAVATLALFVWLNGVPGFVVSAAEWARDSMSTESRDGVNVKIERSDNRTFVAQVQFPEANILKQVHEKQEFTQVIIPGVEMVGGSEKSSGQPAVPVYRRLLAVPQGVKDISVRVGQASPRTPLENVLLYPVQPEPIDQKEDEPGFVGDFGDPPFAFDQAAYSSKDPFPANGNLVQVTRLGRMRDLEVVQLSVAAGQYYPADRKLVLYDSISLQVTFEGGEGFFMLSRRVNNPFEASYRPLYESVLNYKTVFEYLDIKDIKFLCIGWEYLIFTPADFRAAADNLATWKKAKGISTRVVELGKDVGSTKEEIQQYIRDKYDNCLVRPSYVLLLGDAEYIAPWYRVVDGGDNAGTDLDYALIDNSDIMPDLAVGRIPVDTPDQAQTVVDKIVNYEKSPPNNANFYGQMSFASYFQCCRASSADGTTSRSFVETAELVRGQMLTEGYTVERIYTTSTAYHDDPGQSDYYDTSTRDATPRYYYNGTALPADLGPGSGFAWNGATNDIVNAFNAGRFLVFHRDHGGKSGWGSPGFYTSNLGSLNNGDLLPVVYSVNCASGLFDNETNGGDYSTTVNGVYWAEELLRMSGGGAVGIIGDTRNSPTWANSAISRGFFDATWPNLLPGDGSSTPIYRLGDILNYGKSYLMGQVGVSQTAGSVSQASAERDVVLYHVFGDPTLELWTQNPYRIVLPLDFILRQRELRRWAVQYAVDGATITALQNGLPVARASVVNGEADLRFLSEPDAALPIQLSASMSGAISARLQETTQTSPLARPTRTPKPTWTPVPTNTPTPGPTATPTPQLFLAPYRPVSQLVLAPNLLQPDLSIHGIEITQGIQCFDTSKGLSTCADNALSVVAKKDTAARIYLKYSGLLLTGMSNVPVRLYIRANGVWYTGNATGRATATLDQGSSDSANVYFNVNFSNDVTVDFYAVVDPDNAIAETNESNNRYPASGYITMTFRKRDTLKIVGQRLRYHPSGYSGSQYAGGWAVNGGAADWLEQVLPIRNNGINYSVASGYLDWTTSLGSSNGQHDLIRYLNAMWILQNALSWLFGGAFTGADHVYGWAPNAGYSGGHADMPVYPHAGGLGVVGIGTDRPGTSTDNPGGGALIFGHELVHDYDVYHTNTADACGSSDSNSDFPYSSSSIQEYGFNPITGKIYSPTNTHDLMSYCPAGGSREGWISPFTWNKMFGKLSASAALAAEVDAVDQVFRATDSSESLVVNATVYNPNHKDYDPKVPGRLGELYRVPTGIAYSLPDGEYAVQLRNGATVLHSESFAVSFESEYDPGASRHSGGTETDPPFPTDPAPQADFSFIIPWVQGATSVVLLHNDQVLDSRQVSGGSPAVNITGPTTEVSWAAGTTQRLAWESSDPDQDTLSFSVLYSRDGGQSWQLIATELTNRYIDLEVDGLGGSSDARFRVLATDGVNTAMAETPNAISVPNKAPNAIITDPTNGQIVAPGALLVLQGSAVDLEDGRLSDSALRWSSDRQGELGVGPSLPINTLQAGRHVITLRAADSYGQTGQQSVSVTVGYGVYLPSVVK